MVAYNTKDILLHGLLSLLLLPSILSCNIDLQIRPSASSDSFNKNLERELKLYVDETLSKDNYQIVQGITIEPSNKSSNNSAIEEQCKEEGRSIVTSFDDYMWKKFTNYARTHIVSVKIPETARFFKFTGKSSFLTGFGLGFLAFGLKKLLLPMFIGAQIVKSVLIAMFLPSILGSLGKLAAKGISHASTLSGSSGGHQQAPIDDFDFKDTGAAYNAQGTEDEYAIAAPPDFEFQIDPGTTATPAIRLGNKHAMNRFGNGGQYQKVAYVQAAPTDSYYYRPKKQHDYKVFHKIPSSSLLLTTYDPFYSPLLSRLDSVFVQLGLGEGKGPQIEKCRERLICLLYANPVKYMPYSNLISAQLSRELNELRKPTSDNPEILRFFRYMRAAKDGQDGVSCETYSGCPSLQSNRPSPAILTTYNDINKLIHARKLH